MGEKETPREPPLDANRSKAIAGLALALLLNFGQSVWWASRTETKLDSALETIKLMYPRQEAEVRFQAVGQRVDRIERAQDSRRGATARSDGPQ